MTDVIHALLDFSTAIAYMSIPITMLIYLKKRKIKEFSWIFTLFILFIFLCGMTHLMHIVEYLLPLEIVHNFSGLMRALTAFVSAITAVMLWKILPKALLIPSHSELNAINKLLTMEIENHMKTAQKLQYWTAIMKSSNDAIIGLSMDWKIISWNLGAKKLFGYSNEEIMGAKYYRLIPLEHKAEMIEMINKTIKGQRLFHREMNHIDKNGTVINGSITVSPVIDDESKIIGISIIIRDITAKKKLQEEMNKLTQIKTVSEMAASISHEVRNPLTVTRGFTQLLKDGSLSDEQRHQYIKLSLEELDRAERIIGDYLTFAKPSIENKEVLHLNKEIEYIVQVINPYATMNNITVEVNMEDCQYTILGEKQKLHQSLLNIVKNGIEAMENNGKILIQLMKINEIAQLIIKDNGKGMSDEQIKKIGTPYFSTKEKGTGLGTMVAFNIIKAMQGDYKIESQIGKGTSFLITFPLVEAKNNQ